MTTRMAVSPPNMPPAVTGAGPAEMCAELRAPCASATEQLRESPLVLLVLGEHGFEVGPHDPERLHRRIAGRGRDFVEDGEIALACRLALRLLGELPGHEGFRRLDIAAALEDRDRLRDGGDALLREHEVDR